jgi:hypothetical protein
MKLISLRMPYFSANYQNFAPTARVFPVKQVNISNYSAYQNMSIDVDSDENVENNK